MPPAFFIFFLPMARFCAGGMKSSPFDTKTMSPFFALARSESLTALPIVSNTRCLLALALISFRPLAASATTASSVGTPIIMCDLCGSPFTMSVSRMLAPPPPPPPLPFFTMLPADSGCCGGWRWPGALLQRSSQRGESGAGAGGSPAF